MSNNRKQKSGKSTARSVISGITAFILAIVCTALTCLLAAYFGFLNSNTVIVAFNKVDYYADVMEEFKEKAWDITIPLGLPQDVLDDVINITKVSRDVKGSLTAGIDQTDYTVDTEELTIKLDENVRAYFSSQGTALDENQEKVLGEYKASVEKTYLDAVKIPLIQYFGYAKQLLAKVMFGAIPFCIVIGAAATTLIIKIQSWKHRGVRYLIYSSLAAALMSSAVPAGILLLGTYKNIQLSPEHFYDFVMKYIQGGFAIFIYFSIIWILTSVLLLFIISRMKRKLKYRNA